jgi:hypothetical protein
VLAELERVLDGRVGPPPKTKTIARRVRDFVEVRVPLQIPPGFQDSAKVSPAEAAGDYLIWAELLAFARRNKTDLVFVTDDLKSDWWLEGAAGRQTAPHPGLVAEFARETGGRRYFQITARQLLTRAEALGVSVGPEEIEEESQIEQDARERADAEGLLASERSRNVARLLQYLGAQQGSLDFSDLAGSGLLAIGAQQDSFDFSDLAGSGMLGLAARQKARRDYLDHLTAKIRDAGSINEVPAGTEHHDRSQTNDETRSTGTPTQKSIRDSGGGSGTPRRGRGAQPN